MTNTTLAAPPFVWWPENTTFVWLAFIAWLAVIVFLLVSARRGR